MASLRIVCWNSAGLRASAESTPNKIAFFDNKYPNGNFGIAAFVETHHKDESEIPDEIKQYMTTHHLLHTPTPAGETHNGIIVLISKQYSILSKEILIEGRHETEGKNKK